MSQPEVKSCRQKVVSKLGLPITACILLTTLTLFVMGCSQTDVKRLNYLDGLTEQQVIAKLGASPQRDEFPMSKAVGEFRTALQKYDPMPESRDVRVRELTWERSGYYVTTWLHLTNGQWIVFDSLQYGKNVQF
jgi:hypothetical protein